MTRKLEDRHLAASDPSPPVSPFDRQGSRAGSGTVRPEADRARSEIGEYHLMDEAQLIQGLIERAAFTEDERARAASLAARLVRAARANRHKHGGVDAFMHEYGLSSEEGVILMCLA